MNDVRCHVFTTVLCTSSAALPCKMISQGLLCDTLFADSTCFTLCPDSVRTTLIWFDFCGSRYDLLVSRLRSLYDVYCATRNLQIHYVVRCRWICLATRCLRYARGGGQEAQAERQRLTLTASSGGKPETAAGRSGWSLQCTRGQRPYSALPVHLGNRIQAHARQHVSCMYQSIKILSRLFDIAWKIENIKGCGKISTQDDARSQPEDYNFNSGERYNSKTRMRYLPVVPRLVPHPFLQHQKSCRRFHCKLYVIVMRNKSKSIAGQEPLVHKD